MRMTDEQRKLVEQNHNLIYDFLNRNNLSEEEYYDVVAIGLCNAAMCYNNKKGKLSTLANKCMMNEVSKCLNAKYSKTRIPPEKIFSYDILLDEDWSETYIDAVLESDFNTYEIVERSISYANFSKELTDKERFIIKCFESGLNQVEIAKNIGVTQQSISSSIKKLKNKWNKFIKR